MEFIIVTATTAAGAAADVLINRKRAGITGQVIALGTPGHCIVSLDTPGAEERMVDVVNTTAVHPLAIEIRVGGSHAR